MELNLKKNVKNYSFEAAPERKLSKSFSSLFRNVSPLNMITVAAAPHSKDLYVQKKKEILFDFLTKMQSELDHEQKPTDDTAN